MCFPRIGSWGLSNLSQFLDIGGQVHWHKKYSKCAQTPGAYAVGGIVIIARRFHLGQAFPDFGETGLDIVVGPLGMVW